MDASPTSWRSDARASWAYRIAARQFPLLALLAFPVAFVTVLTEGSARGAVCLFLSSVAAASLANGGAMLWFFAREARERGLAGFCSDPGPSALFLISMLILLALGGILLAGAVLALEGYPQ